MKLALLLCLFAGSVQADSSTLALSLPNPPMNYQSDTFRAGNLHCSNAVGGGINLEFGVMGNVNNVGGSFGSSGSISQGKDIGIYSRIVIPLDRPKSRINCDDLYQVELAQRRLEIQILRDELDQLKSLQEAGLNSGEGMDFEN
jgi:hypothetical protein|tara:strand:- start:9254 stop:9685 length:432 start_codon:yes stop_codon:yes gene_type:complete